MYDYLVVGSGLYGAIFAHEAKASGKSVLVVGKTARILQGMFIQEKGKGFRFTGMVHIFSIRLIKRYGIT